LANPGENGYLQMLDVPSWRQVFEINLSTDPFAFWDEGHLLAACSYDSVNLKGMIRIVDTNFNKEVSSFQYDTQVRTIAFSLDGKYISAIDYLDNLVTWETSTGHIVSTKFIPDIGSALIASPDHFSWFFVNSGKDILIIDMVNGTEIERIDTGEGISALSISPDGNFIASGGVGGKVQIWHWRPEELITEACSRLPRNLTQSEWKQYLGNEPYHPTCPDLPIPTE
jgi:WD40 repeat protein